MLLHSTHQMFPVIVTLLLLFLLPDLTTNEIRFAFHLRIEVSLILSRLSLSLENRPCHWSGRFY